MIKALKRNLEKDCNFTLLWMIVSSFRLKLPVPSAITALSESFHRSPGPSNFPDYPMHQSRHARRQRSYVSAAGGTTERISEHYMRDTVSTRIVSRIGCRSENMQAYHVHKRSSMLHYHITSRSWNYWLRSMRCCQIIGYANTFYLSQKKADLLKDF